MCSGVNEALIVVGASLPVFLIILVGMGLRKTKIIKPEMDKGFMVMAVHWLFPALILSKMIGNEVLFEYGLILPSVVFGFLSVSVFLGLGMLLAPLFGFKKVGSGKRTFAVVNSLQNYGYMAIPLVFTLFPDDGAVAVLFTHNIGVELAMWTVCLMCFSGSFSFSWKTFMKGPILGVIFGLLITYTGLAPYIPDFVMRTLEMLGNCALPLSILLIGLTMYDIVLKVKFNFVTSGSAVFLRLMLFPLIMLFAASLIPMALPLKQVIVVQAAMPAAMFPIVLARHYGGLADVAIESVVATSLVSFFTMPLAIAIGSQWLGI